MKIQLILTLSILLSAPFLAFADTASVTVSGVDMTFDYTGTGVSITNVDSDLDSMSLILTVDTTGNPGVLEVTFDRTFFDSKIGQDDEPFLIIADGDEPTFDETNTTDSSRTLRIEVPVGTEEVEIIGTVLSASPQEPTTQEPTTQEPTTQEPTTQEPTTQEPTTQEPTTQEPTTQEPKPKPDTTNVVCGEGTVLKDGLCVLDETCGEGTILKDGVCVLAPVEETTSDSKGLGYEGMVGVIAGFVVAGIIAGILALMSKGSRSKN